MDKFAEVLAAEVIPDLAPMWPHRTQHQSYPSENAGVDLHSEGTARVAEKVEAEVDTGVALNPVQALAQSTPQLKAIYAELCDAVRDGDTATATELRQAFISAVARPNYKPREQ